MGITRNTLVYARRGIDIDEYRRPAVREEGGVAVGGRDLFAVAIDVFFGVGLLRGPLGQADGKIVHLFECIVKLAAQVLSHCSIHLCLALMRTEVMFREKSLEHQVDDVGSGEMRIDFSQPVNALKQHGIQTIRHLSFSRASSRHTIDMRHIPLYTIGI